MPLLLLLLRRRRRQQQQHLLECLSVCLLLQLRLEFIFPSKISRTIPSLVTFIAMLSAMRATCSRATAPLRAACSRSSPLLSARQSPSFGCFAALSPAQETCALRSRPSFAFSRAFSSGVPEHTVLLMPALSPTMTQVRCGGGRVLCSCGGGRVLCSEGWAGAAAAEYFQGNIAAWLKKVGDKISPGDAIAELETDKVRAPRRLPPFLPDAFAFLHRRPCGFELRGAVLTSVLTFGPAGDAWV